MERMLRAYMAMKPIRRAHTPHSVWTFGMLMNTRAVAGMLVVALFISSGGVSYAAEGALPGDFLYAVKTGINEPLQGALAVTQSAKTAWAMEVAGERVKEATTLAAQGRLDTETQGQLETSFSRHAQLAASGIEEQASISLDIGIEAATRFEAQLGEYQRVLTEVAFAKHVSADDLSGSVEREGARIALIRAQAESAVGLEAGTPRAAITARYLRDAAKHAVDASSRLARSASSALASSSAEGVSLQLDDASTSISDGERLLSDDANAQALGTFRDALTATEKLGVFLQTSSAIHKRTGLRIGNPREESSGAPASRAVGTQLYEGESNEGKNPKKGERGTPVQTAAKASENEATLMMSALPATATPQQEEDHGKDEERKTFWSDAEREDDDTLLPLALPGTILR